ncbi:MAG TPA: dTDP-4-amino-4,6-dideoxygalactose transaminase [Solirubrobacteraceae bacterium]|jgi:dTDP-4-amino-4,6-dideoxygalactose transaminase|nr:dTDP-4-amino-4,6-dideoxygalactose transaminase [Solirubrobacteraceae bacterium]
MTDSPAPVAVPFNRAQTVGDEMTHVDAAVAGGRLAGNGRFARRCAAWLRERIGCGAAFMTPSCSAGLEMAARLAGVRAGDEVIVPSFTFVSTASAVVRAGGTPVFVDIDPKTLNLDPEAAAAGMGPRTRAIAIVHYGGVACDIDSIRALARGGGLVVIEDAAHAIGATWRDWPLGSLGHLAALSFHDTKNLQCGEGGALLVNDAALIADAERMHDRGTNRGEFARGEADHYTWIGEGSNYLMSELSAAFLWGQLERADAVTAERRSLWATYWDGFAELERRGVARRPVVPPGCEHNGHIFYLLLEDRRRRDALIKALAAERIRATFHYIPLHSSPAGQRFGRVSGDMRVTDSVAGRIVRLPLWPGLGEDGAARVIAAVYAALGVGTRIPLPA